MSLSNQEIEMDDFDFDDGGEDDNAFVVLMVAEKAVDCSARRWCAVRRNRHRRTLFAHSFAVVVNLRTQIDLIFDKSI